MSNCDNSAKDSDKAPEEAESPLSGNTITVTRCCTIITSMPCPPPLPLPEADVTSKCDTEQSSCGEWAKQTICNCCIGSQTEEPYNDPAPPPPATDCCGCGCSEPSEPEVEAPPPSYADACYQPPNCRASCTPPLVTDARSAPEEPNPPEPADTNNNKDGSSCSYDNSCEVKPLFFDGETTSESSASSVSPDGKCSCK